MANIGHFNAAEVDTELGYEPVPPGVYTMMITASDRKTVRDKPGNSYLFLEHTIIEGPFNGRKVFNNMSLWSDNPKAVRVANAYLGQLCLATGVIQLTDSEQLHNIPFMAEVSVDAKDPKYVQNRIAKYVYDKKKPGETTSAASPSPVAGGGVPWANG